MHHSGKSGMHNIVLLTNGFVYYYKKAVTKVSKIIMQLPFRLWNGKKLTRIPEEKVFVTRDISKGLTIAKVVQRVGSTAQT